LNILERIKSLDFDEIMKLLDVLCVKYEIKKYSNFEGNYIVYLQLFI